MGELGGTQGQGSSVSGRAGGLGGAVMTGEGRLGETPSPNPAAGRVSPPSSRKETRRPVLSLFTGFFKFGVTVSLRGPPGGPVAETLPARGQGSIPGQDIKDSVCCNEHLAQPNK